MTHLLKLALFAWWFVIAQPTGERDFLDFGSFPTVKVPAHTGKPAGPFVTEGECKAVRKATVKATTDERVVIRRCFEATGD